MALGLAVLARNICVGVARVVDVRLRVVGAGDGSCSKGESDGGPSWLRWLGLLVYSWWFRRLSSLVRMEPLLRLSVIAALLFVSLYLNFHSNYPRPVSSTLG